MTINTYKICARCKRRDSSVRWRRNYGLRCDRCMQDIKRYSEHWLVRSLIFKPHRLPKLKPRKPLPGQLELFKELPPQ